MLDHQRNWLNKHPSVAVVGSIVLLLAAGAFAVIRKQRFLPIGTAQAWYYDTVTGEHFVDSGTLVPPYFRSNGNEAVRAYPFSCAGCEPGTLFIGYYEKYDEQMKATLQLANDPNRLGPLAAVMQGRLFSRDGQEWFDAVSPEGIAITSNLQARCPPKTLLFCPPTDDDGQLRSLPHGVSGPAAETQDDPTDGPPTYTQPAENEFE